MFDSKSYLLKPEAYWQVIDAYLVFISFSASVWLGSVWNFFYITKHSFRTFYSVCVDSKRTYDEWFTELFIL